MLILINGNPPEQLGKAKCPALGLGRNCPMCSGCDWAIRFGGKDSRARQRYSRLLSLVVFQICRDIQQSRKR